MSSFQPLEVVGRGSETQPQVVEHLNELRVILIMLIRVHNYFTDS